MDDIKKQYEEFKEKICLIGFIDTLYVIWAFSNNLQYNKPTPSDIELPPKYNDYNDPNYRRVFGFPEWELDIILLFTLLYSPRNTIALHSLKSFKNCASIINNIREIRNVVEKSYLGNDEVLSEFFRIAHRQFPWQQNINASIAYKFFYIFSHPTLNDLIKSKTGLSTYELYITCLLFTSHFKNTFYKEIDLKYSIGKIPDEQIRKFINYFSITPCEFKERYENTIKYDNQFLYNFNPIRKHPIIAYNNRLYCPIPTLLLWKITNGMYYDIVNEKGFDKAMGESFEAYCGLVLRKVLDSRIKIIPEIPYGKSYGKKSADWILIEKNSFLFIECKAKRLKLGSKLELLKSDDIYSDLDKMAEFINQAYKSLNDAINNIIPGINISACSKIYVLVLTLEDWFLDLAFNYKDYIYKSVCDRLLKNKLSLDMISKYPYFIFSSDNFEKNIQVINKFGLDLFFEKYKNNSISDLIDQTPIYELFIDEFKKEILQSFELELS